MVLDPEGASSTSTSTSTSTSSPPRRQQWVWVANFPVLSCKASLFHRLQRTAAAAAAAVASSLRRDDGSSATAAADAMAAAAALDDRRPQQRERDASSTFDVDGSGGGNCGWPRTWIITSPGDAKRWHQRYATGSSATTGIGDDSAGRQQQQGAAERMRWRARFFVKHPSSSGGNGTWAVPAARPAARCVGTRPNTATATANDDDDDASAGGWQQCRRGQVWW